MKHIRPLVSLELENQSINGNVTAVDSTVSLYCKFTGCYIAKKKEGIQVTWFTKVKKAEKLFSVFSCLHSDESSREQKREYSI